MKKQAFYSFVTKMTILSLLLSMPLYPTEASAETVSKKTITFDESGNRSSSKSIDIPSLVEIKAVTVNNGEVAYKQNGQSVDLSVSEGVQYGNQWNPTKFSKAGATSLGSYSDSFASSITHSDTSGYSGTLYKNGSSYVSSGSYTPSENLWVTAQTSNYYNSGGYSGYLSSYLYSSSYVSADSIYVTAQTSSYYNSGGYSGSLSSYVYSGSYTASDSKTVTASRTGTFTCSWAWNGSSWYQDGNWTDSVPTSVSYNSGGYSGTLKQTSKDHTTCNFASMVGAGKGTSVGQRKTASTPSWADYSGTVTKPGSDTRVYRYQGYVTRPGYYNDTYRYQGTVTKPAVDTRYYTQNYAGTMYAGGNEPTYKYEVTVTYLKDDKAPNAPTLTANEEWSKTNETILLADNGDNGADIVSGVDRVEYKLQGATVQDWKSSTGSLVISNEGATKITARVVDKAGNTSPLVEKNVKIDKQSPTIEYTVNQTNWTNTSPTVTIKASDTLSGVKRILLPDGNWVNGATASYVVNANGSFDIQAEDNAGNLTTKNIQVANIDKNAPTVKVTLSPSDWTNQSVVIRVDGEDAGSGMKRIQLPTGSYVNSQTATYTVTSNGTYTFKVEDNVGNVKTESVFVTNIDKVAPIGIITPSTTAWTGEEITLLLLANDAESGVSRIQVPNGSWVQGSATTYQATVNGTYTFVIEDNAGNKGTVSTTISNLDKTKPSIPVITTTTTWVKAESVTATIKSGTDGQSGVASVEYKLEGATTKGWTTYDGTVSIEAEGETKLSARTVDKVGNRSDEASAVIKIDRSSPINSGILLKLKP